MWRASSKDKKVGVPQPERGGLVDAAGAVVLKTCAKAAKLVQVLVQERRAWERVGEKERVRGGARLV